MRYSISGEIAQTARMELEQGEGLWAAKGSIVAYSAGVRWDLRIPGGLDGAVRRSLSGEGVSLAVVTADSSAQHCVLAANQPGHIAVWDLARGPVITTRGAFLAAWGEAIDIDVTVARRAGAAFFGGAGLFLQQVSGAQGLVLIHGSGDFDERELAPGEQLLVSTGNLAAFAKEVDYDIVGVRGARRVLFGREGLFMTRLTGPGWVLLQTLKRRSGTSSSG